MGGELKNTQIQDFMPIYHHDVYILAEFSEDVSQTRGQFAVVSLKLLFNQDSSY